MIYILYFMLKSQMPIAIPFEQLAKPIDAFPTMEICELNKRMYQTRDELDGVEGRLYYCIPKRVDDFCPGQE